LSIACGMLFLVAIFGCDFSCLYHSFGVHVNCSCCWAICATLCCNVLELVEKTDMRVSRCIHLYHLVLFFSTHLTHHLSHPPLKYVTQGFSYSFSIRIWLGLSKEQWSCQSLASSYLRLPFFSISSLPRSRRTRSARSTSELLSHGPPYDTPISVANATDCTQEVYPRGWFCCIDAVRKSLRMVGSVWM
jgi:hypothetical protein